MRSTRRLTSMLLGAALLATGVASGVAAQEPSGSPAAPQTCGVLTADEVSAALGLTVTVASGGITDCAFDADYSAGTYVSLITNLDTGDLDTIRTVMCEFGSLSASPSPSAAASTAPCGVDLQISGLSALYLPDTMGTLLYVAPVPGSLFDLQLVGDLAAGVDKQVALTGLTELALGRLASMPLPTPGPTAQSFHAAPDLEALLPAQIGGADVIIQSMSGAQLSSGGAVPAEFTAALSGMGKTIDDVRVAFASVGLTAETHAGITAFQVQGTDMSALKSVLLPLLYQGQPVGAETAQQVGGKDVTSADVGGTLTYLYPHGDVLWVVIATDPSLTEIFQKLP